MPASVSGWLLPGHSCPCDSDSVAGGTVSGHGLIALSAWPVSMSNCCWWAGNGSWRAGTPSLLLTPSSAAVISERGAKSRAGALMCPTRTCLSRPQELCSFSEGAGVVGFSLPLTFSLLFRNLINLLESRRDWKRAERDSEKLPGPCLCLTESAASKLPLRIFLSKCHGF